MSLSKPKRWRISPAFTAMYSNVYDRLPDNLRRLETANCIEEVCEFFYISGTVDSWKIA